MFEFCTTGGCGISKKIAPPNLFFYQSQSIYSGKFKHLKYSENNNFEGTNSFDSILVVRKQFTYELCSQNITCKCLPK